MRPNILLITSDQQRYDYFGSREMPCLRVPTLDRLRSEGAWMPNVFTNNPICMPTRFTWLHGLYARQASMPLLRNGGDWPTRYPTFAQHLQALGYQTALIGKLHAAGGLHRRNLMAEEPRTRARGFDDVVETSGGELSYWHHCQWAEHLARKGLLERWRHEVVRKSCWFFGGQEDGAAGFLEPEDTLDGFTGRHARQWLRDVDTNRPFFVHVSFCGPHNPYKPPREYLDRYRPEDMPDAEGVSDPDRRAYWRRIRAAYCAMISHIDDEIGRILDGLDERGLAESTLVIYTTDHGCMVGHGNRGTKGTPDDTSTRTPVILRWPGTIPAGVERTGLFEAVDLPATLIEAAGGEPVERVLPGSPARSYLGHAIGREAEGRPFVFSECGVGLKAWHMVRTHRWKYVFSQAGDVLRDMQADPFEFQNRIAEPALAETVAGLRRNLMEAFARCAAPLVPPGTR